MVLVVLVILARSTTMILVVLAHSTVVVSPRACVLVHPSSASRSCPLIQAVSIVSQHLLAIGSKDSMVKVIRPHHSRGHYNQRKAAKWTRIIVGVLKTCHSLGAMHRDLKLENFLLVNKDHDFSLKVVDFILSVFFKPGQTFTEVVRSPYYIAPKDLMKYYGPEADVWTAGVIVYILLSGVPPFWAGRPWICEHEVAPDRVLDPTILSRLKHFFAMNKLKKMACGHGKI
ncbi:hypothetical protein Cgig2_020299 [Carnegiea gigantea]|uniref:Protein kinase domain-containing protein n=1 Tax=Carnegiea gigantea TaxID=171969 RepID=A0A9Q1JJH5_9CARY|nr:hypothetical protein Cgig2_001899 [Carnegiea gigantea]KAJ8438744.1 hypothetical protein Cgig2_020299 [Carnegiea gigantea]